MGANGVVLGSLFTFVIGIHTQNFSSHGIWALGATVVERGELVLSSTCTRPCTFSSHPKKHNAPLRVHAVVS